MISCKHKALGTPCANYFPFHSSLHGEASILNQVINDTNLFTVGEKLIFVTYIRLRFDCQFEMASPRGYTVPQRVIPD